MKSETITSLINLFLSTTQGNDCYSLRYHILKTIYKVDGADFPPNIINESELYNLQFNYDYFSNPSKSKSPLMVDFRGGELAADLLEKRLQEILDIMFDILGAILKKYEYIGDFGFK